MQAVKPRPPSLAPEAAPRRTQRGELAHDFNNAVAIVLLNAQLVLDQLLPDHPLRAELVEMCAAAERASSLAKLLVPGSGASIGVPAPPAPPTAPVQGGTVLVVEHDESVRGAVQRTLSARGFRVLSARDGAEAESMARSATAIDLVLSDLDLPGHAGAAIAQKICERHPETRILFMSGSEQAHSEQFLQKPFTPQVLLRKVRLMLEAAP